MKTEEANAAPKMEEKIDDLTGQKMYKSLCCGSWEFDVTKDGMCQPCFQFEIDSQDD